MNINKKQGKDLTLEEITLIGQSLLNKSFREISNNEEILHKGGFGHFIERNVFNIEPNSSPEPDFIQAATELKVTPVRKLRNGEYSAKERLVLNIIDYNDEAKRDFFTSSFWKKNSLLYILFYLFEEDRDKLDFLILKDLLLDFNDTNFKNDLAIIKNDWNIIHEKILAGRAHEISESDTMYLAACTKGVNSDSMRIQPFSSVPAKQRAYSFKNSYMTELFNREPLPSLLDLLVDAITDEPFNFEEIIKHKISPYIGKSQDELQSIFEISSNSKNLNEMLLAAMLGLKNTRVSKTDEFRKSNIIPKTIRVEENNKIKEHMSFETFEFTKIIDETWEESRLRNFFSNSRLMFVVFKKSNTEYIFQGVTFWSMPEQEIDGELKEVWLRTVDIIQTGKILKRIYPSTLTNFPKPSENRISHVRPHAKDSRDTFPLPVADLMTGYMRYTKQCFWLNNTYLYDKIKHLF